MDGLFQLGNEDTSLAFTLYGFDRHMKLAHFQYYAATIESDCHDEKSAKKRWTKVSRMTESLHPWSLFSRFWQPPGSTRTPRSPRLRRDSKPFAPLWRKPIRRRNRRSSTWKPCSYRLPASIRRRPRDFGRR